MAFASFNVSLCAIQGATEPLPCENFPIASFIVLSVLEDGGPFDVSLIEAGVLPPRFPIPHNTLNSTFINEVASGFLQAKA
jgi:hypothetical protein